MELLLSPTDPDSLYPTLAPDEEPADQLDPLVWDWLPEALKLTPSRLIPPPVLLPFVSEVFAPAEELVELLAPSLYPQLLLVETPCVCPADSLSDHPEEAFCP